MLNLLFMQELFSRRDFLKTATGYSALVFLPSLAYERIEDEPKPLTELPVLFTHNTPVKVNHLDYRGRQRYDIEPEWTTFSNIPVDILPPMMPVRAKDLGLIPQDNYDHAWVAKLPHVTGTPTEFMAVVAWGDDEFYRLFNGTFLSKGGDIISTYAYSEKPNIYANKIWNDLTALAAIAKWQKEKGPLNPGDEFSYLRMTDVIELVYEDYKRSTAYWAGGICATVTTISKAVFLAIAQGYAQEIKRTRHTPQYEYWASPLDPGITKVNSDASTKFILDSKLDDWRNIDYRFKVREDSDTPIYLSFEAHLVNDEEPDIGNDYYPPADTRFTMSVTLTKTPPLEDEEEKLLEIREDYAQFHQFKT